MGTASKTRAPLWHPRQLCMPRGWMFSRLLWVPTPRSEVPCVFWQIHCSGWFCCLCGRGRSPLGMTSSPPSRAATKLQGADLKGGRKSWGWGGGWPTDAETGKGSLAAPDAEAEEQWCLIQCPSNAACVSLLGKCSILGDHVTI